MGIVEKYEQSEIFLDLEHNGYSELTGQSEPNISTLDTIMRLLRESMIEIEVCSNDNHEDYHYGQIQLIYSITHKLHHNLIE